MIYYITKKEEQKGCKRYLLKPRFMIKKMLKIKYRKNVFQY